MDGINWTQVISVVIVVGTVISFMLSLTWKVSAWKTRVDGQFEKVDEKFKKVDGQFKAIHVLLATLTTKVDDLTRMFMDWRGQTVAKSSSPLSLTDYGEKLSQAVDAPALAARYAQRLEGRAKGLNPYQIQELCFQCADDDILKDLESHDTVGFNRVTTCAFEEGIDTSKIMRVLGILMRDILLKQAGHHLQSAGDHAHSVVDHAPPMKT